MIKASPYIQTIGSEKFKEFLIQPFSLDQLHTFDVNQQVLFDGWHSNKLQDYISCSNQNGVVLEFYPEVYIIQKSFNAPVCQLPLPKTIDDFVNDMARCDIPLYWSKWVDENFEPKDYLPQDGILEYFTNLLKRMHKSHELS